MEGYACIIILLVEHRPVTPKECRDNSPSYKWSLLFIDEVLEWTSCIVSLITPSCATLDGRLLTGIYGYTPYVLVLVNG